MTGNVRPETMERITTKALANGMDIKTLSQVIGHVSSSTTVNVRNPHTN